jgi:hypothetical protein
MYHPPLAVMTTQDNAAIFQNSIALDPKIFENEDYFCSFMPRIHRDAHLADASSVQCQMDFLDSGEAIRLGPTRTQEKDHTDAVVGSINPTAGNFTALCLCEALPDRLALASYMVEYAYLQDDGRGYLPKSIHTYVDMILVVIEYAESRDEAQVNTLLQTTTSFVDC